MLLFDIKMYSGGGYRSLKGFDGYFGYCVSLYRF